MNSLRMSILCLPLAWLGVVGTAVTYTALARAHVDVSLILASLRIRNNFTLALCLYGVWTLVAALVLWSLLVRDEITEAAVGLDGWPPLTDFVLAVVGAALAIALWPLVHRVMPSVGGSPPAGRMLNPQLANEGGPWEFFLLTLVGAILVPALEEFVFRGYVLTALLAPVSVVGAVLLSSLVFASIHIALGRGAVAYAYVLSLMLSGLFLSSGSLYPPIVMHSLVNLFGLVVAPILWHSRSPRPARGQKSDA
jgi:membrane protease YdiL (CAAX protease family)